MAFSEVQCAEVVPVVLDLWPFGDLEAESEEDCFEPLDGLGDQVLVAVPAASAGVLGQVEALGFEPRRALGRGQSVADPGDRGLDVVTRLLERNARCFPICGVELAE